MHFRTAIACAAILLGSAATSGAQTVSLQFDNGNVTVNAQNASIRTILTEWARLGGTRIVNHERLGGAPVNLELINVPEQRALDVLLRSAAGYVLTGRQGSTGASMIGGLVILPTTSAPRTPAAITFGAATPPPGPTFDDPRDDLPPAAAARPNAANGSGSPFSVTPGPAIGGPQVIRVGPGATAQFGTPADTVPPTTTPATTPAPPLPSQRPSNVPQMLPGTSRPGEITPVPQQQPNQR